MMLCMSTNAYTRSTESVGIFCSESLWKPHNPQDVVAHAREPELARDSACLGVQAIRIAQVTRYRDLPQSRLVCRWVPESGETAITGARSCPSADAPAQSFPPHRRVYDRVQHHHTRPEHDLELPRECARVEHGDHVLLQEGHGVAVLTRARP